jgi:hypothetical protein
MFPASCSSLCDGLVIGYDTGPERKFLFRNDTFGSGQWTEVGDLKCTVLAVPLAMEEKFPWPWTDHDDFAGRSI